MKNLSILICDCDESYVKALVRYLVGSRKGFEITYYTSVERFQVETGTYQVALMTEEFLREEEENPGEDRRIGTRIQLCNGDESSYKGTEVLYKFQSMDAFCSRLLEARWEGKGKPSHVSTFGIYSPTRHELTLPFALLSAQLMAESRRVLLVDLEANSMIYELTHHDMRMCVLDAIYELEMRDEKFVIEDYLEQYEGFSILGPVNHPTDLMGIRSEQWMRLIAKLKQTTFDSIIFLFGELPQGFEYFMDAIDQVTILEKPGEYFRPSQEHFVKYLKEEHPDLSVEEVLLPMSARGIPEGGYQMEALMRGKLGQFLRDLFEKRTRYGV